MLVCKGCCNEVPQTGGLKNRNVLFHGSGGRKSKIEVMVPWLLETLS